MNDNPYLDPVLDDAQSIARRYLASLPTRPVRAAESHATLVARATQPLTDAGLPATEVLRELDAVAEAGVVASAGPRYFGFVIGGSYPVALAADWLVSTWDQNPGIYATSPFCAVVEDVAAGYVVDLLRLPRGSTVGFVTGCQMANFTALAAARNHVLAKAGWDVEANGLIGAPRVHLVLGAEAHVTVHTALRYLGFGLAQAQTVPIDAQGRMDPDALRDTLARCDGPTIVCAQAGNVNSGAFDDFTRIAPMVREHGGWLHVDGAFGLWARASRTYAHLAEGAELCDSWATDAHKWLNVPYDCGVVIVKHGEAHRRAMSVRAAYLQHAAATERDELEYVPEFSRRGRSVPVYATLRHLGRHGVEALVDRCCAHARRFGDALARAPGVDVLNDVVLNQVLVRFGDDDDITRAVIARVQQDGTCWLGGTNWRGRAAMRISVCNWATGDDDVRRSIAAILAAFDAVR